MPQKRTKALAHSGKTEKGHTRDVKIERIGSVTIYRRGTAYYLYYREAGQSKRVRIDGNLAVARASAGEVVQALNQDRPAPFNFVRTSPDELVRLYLDFVEHVQERAWRTCERYRAALQRFLDFTCDREIAWIDRVTYSSVEEFVRWLRGQTRCRNGSKKGKKERYQKGGIEFILSTCRTAYNWAAKNRRLPPYADNPFSEFSSASLGDESEQEREIFTATQEKAFFAACTAWQKMLFIPLAGYGLRCGELTHLLIENVDFNEGVIRIRSKPELMWHIKTRDRRDIPITGPTGDLLRHAINGRSAGFVFLNQKFFAGTQDPAQTFTSDRQFRHKLEQVVTELSDATRKQQRRIVVAYCRSMGQLPEKRIRDEFCKLTKKIGCPEFTRAHDLRHFFSTRTQERGGNPLLVREITGHNSTEMLGHYTHFGMDTKRAALESFHKHIVGD